MKYIWGDFRSFRRSQKFPAFHIRSFQGSPEINSKCSGGTEGYRKNPGGA